MARKRYSFYLDGKNVTRGVIVDTFATKICCKEEPITSLLSMSIADYDAGEKKVRNLINRMNARGVNNIKKIYICGRDSFKIEIVAE